jgi:hypothetical protein
MEKARELRQDEVKANPLLQDLLERAKAGGEQVITYEGLTLILQPIEDITHTFSPEELERFKQAYAAAEDPSNRFTAAEALVRFRARSKQDG